jgi:hypothetical protein
MKSAMTSRLLAIALLAAAAIVLYGAAVDFYNVASGTGNWIGQLSLKWAAAFALFVAFCVLCMVAACLAVWRPSTAAGIVRKLAVWRSHMGSFRFLVAALFLLVPIWFLQYSPWGVVFGRPYSRLLIWIFLSLLTAVLISSDTNHLTSWPAVLIALLLSGTGFALATPLMGVTDYPFALNWSEGNRLWDYSLLFGSHLYEYPPNSQPSAYLDLGRQVAGGLPFLLPHVSIVGERLWLAVLTVIPYLALAWFMFWPRTLRGDWAWILAGTWGFLFLNQGPIHTPLLGVAALVAIAWRLHRWPAAVLVLVAAYVAEISRFTWVFAPSIWIVMLELGGADLTHGTIPRSAWERAITSGLAGLLGGAMAVIEGLSPGGTSITATAAASTKQPLLWYRLLPNATYGYGILLGLFVASAPLIALLLALAARQWRRHWLQRLALILPMLAFLVVGLIVSTKIGGGGDLHNLDMFLIGLLFIAALIWRVGGSRWLLEIQDSSTWIRALSIVLIAVPAYQPLMEMRPVSFAGDANWLAVLADVQRPRDLGSLPAPATVDVSLQKLRRAVQDAQARGPVLFMDQRQLLTFGYITNVELIQDYEKKRMMDEALSGNAAYFRPFYQDLAAHRFSLIISSLLRTPIKDSDYGFGEENNAWVQWVAKPVLCYYAEQDTLNDVKVELLAPRATPTHCSSLLP